MMPTITRQLALIIAVVALALIVAFVGPAQCRRINSQASQAKLERAQSTAAAESAKDAMIVVSGAGEREAGSEGLSRSNEREIRAAPGASERVNSGVDLAGRAALCRREAYRADAKCAMFRKDGR